MDHSNCSVNQSAPSSGREGICVAIRMRPLNDREIASGQEKIFKCQTSTNAVTHIASGINQEHCTHYFDKVFDENATNHHVYHHVAQNIVLGVMSGINGTIFAYGQTSSGKTHTMMGGADQKGIIGMAAEDIFNYLASHPTRDFILRASFVEIYNEVIRDLLSDSTDASVAIREDPRKGVYCEAIEMVITDFDSISKLLRKGLSRRVVESTAMNEQSSRSHSIFRLVVESRESGRGGLEPDGAVLVASLNLVDLAGSESVRHTGAMGQRAKEGGKINQSLLSLSRVIHALSQPGTHVNFRDSKLTRLLQPSLSGNAKMSVVCCITPAERYVEETRSTLQFASRAKLVVTHATVNEVVDESVQLKRLRKELEALKEKHARSSGPDNDYMFNLEKEKLELQQRVIVLEEQNVQQVSLIQQLRDEMNDSSDASAKKRKLSSSTTASDDSFIHPAADVSIHSSESSAQIDMLTAEKEELLQRLNLEMGANAEFAKEKEQLIDNLTLRLKQAEAKLLSFETQNANLTLEITEQNGMLAKARDVSDEMTLRLKELEDQNVGLQREFSQYREASTLQSSSLQCELHSLRSELDEKLQQANLMSMEIINLQTTIADCQARRQENKRALEEDSKATIEALKAENSTYLSEIKDINEALTHLNSERSEIASKNEELEGLLSEADDNIGKLRHALLEKDSLIAKQQSQYCSMESLLQENRASLSLMELDLKEKCDKIEVLSLALTEAADMRSQHQGQFTADSAQQSVRNKAIYEAALTAAQHAKNSMEEEIKSLFTRLCASQSEAQIVQNENMQLKSSLMQQDLLFESIRDREQQLINKASEHEDLVLSLREKLDREVSMVNETEAKLQLATNEMSGLSAQLLMKEGELNDLRIAMEQRVMCMEARASELAQQLDTSCEQNRLLQQSNEDLVTRLDIEETKELAHQKNIMDYEERLEHLVLQVEEMRVKNEELEHEKSLESERLKQELTLAQDRIQSDEAMKMDLHAEISVLQRQVLETQTALEAEKSNLNALELARVDVDGLMLDLDLKLQEMSARHEKEMVCTVQRLEEQRLINASTLSELETMKGEYSCKASLVNEFEQKINELMMENTQLERLLASLTDENALALSERNRELEALRAEVMQLSNRLAEREEAYRSLSSSNVSTLARVAEMELTQSEVDQARKELQRQADSMHSQQMLQDAELSRLMQENGNLTLRTKQLEESMKMMNQQQVIFEESDLVVKKRLSQLQTEIDLLKGEKACLENKLNDKESELKSYAKQTSLQVNALEKQLADINVYQETALAENQTMRIALDQSRSMQLEYQALSRELQSVRISRDSTAEELNELKGKYTDLKDHYDNLLEVDAAGQLQSNALKIAAMSDELISLKEDLQAVNIRLKKSFEEKQLMMSEMQEVQRSSETVSASYHSARATIETLERRETEMVHQIAGLQEVISSLREELNAFQVRGSELMASRNEVNNLRQLLQDYELKVSELTMQCMVKQEALEVVEMSNNQLKQDCTAIQELLRVAEETETSLSCEVKQNNIAFDDMKVQLSDKIQSQEAMIAKGREMVHQLQAEISQLQVALTDGRQLQESMVKDHESKVSLLKEIYERDLESFKAELNACNDRFEEQQQKFATLKEIADKAEDAFHHATQQVGELQIQLSNSELNLSSTEQSYRSEVQALQQQLGDCKEHVKVMQKTIEAKDKQLNDSQLELASLHLSLNANTQDMAKEVENYKLRISELEKTIVTKDERIVHLDAAKLTKDQLQKIKKVKEDKKLAEDEVKVLKHQLVELKQAYDSLKQRLDSPLNVGAPSQEFIISDLKFQVAEMQRKFEQSEKRCEMLRNKLQECATQLEEYEQEHNELLHILQSCGLDVSHLDNNRSHNSTNSSLESAVAPRDMPALVSELAAKFIDCKDLELQLANADRQRCEFTEKLLCLEKELATTNDQLAAMKKELEEEKAKLVQLEKQDPNSRAFSATVSASELQVLEEENIDLMKENKELRTELMRLKTQSKALYSSIAKDADATKESGPKTSAKRVFGSELSVDQLAAKANVPVPSLTGDVTVEKKSSIPSQEGENQPRPVVKRVRANTQALSDANVAGDCKQN